MIRERLKEGMAKVALQFSSSIHHDRHIFYYDILVDIAHVLTLHRAGYLKEEEAGNILRALKQVRNAGYRDDWKFEDIHEAIETEVTAITEDGARMHTARSRNDEVATCLRLFARDRLLNVMENLVNLLDVVLRLAENNHSLMPGFTHLQYAQPTRVSHHLIAYHDMLERDFERAVEIYRRVNKCPLGSAAFASSSYKLDREYAAKLLGFDDIVENSEDAVASRDFLIESVYLCTSIMLSLSRIAEEVILWSSEFGFIELSDRYASVSSIMPQKKNPDIAELLRANAGRLIGNLSTVTSIYKALPFSYNRDFQEMNEVLYDSLLRTELALEVAAGMLSEIKFKEDVMRDKVAKEFVCATDLADMLVKNYGLPFRVAHRIVARLAHSEIFKPRASDIQEVAKDFGFNIKLSEDDLRKAMDIDSIVESRIIRGGTALEEVTRMLVERKKRLEEKRAIIEKLKRKVADALENLYTEAMKLGVDFHGSG